MPDLSKLSFFSAENYMKKDVANSGSTTLTLGAAGAVTSHTVNHNLGYVPFFIVGAQLQTTRILWSNDYVHAYTQSVSASPDYPVALEFWCTTTQLTIRLRNGAGTGEQSGSREVYWNIYKDYGV